MDWAVASLDLQTAPPGWETVAGDASSRRYFRLRDGDRSVICADSPPATENNTGFLDVRALLAGAGLPVPALLAADLERGFLLLEDFGDLHLQQALDPIRPPPDYLGALDLLLEMQAVDTAESGLPEYSADLLREEFSRFYQWFCLKFLGMSDRKDASALVAEFGETLIEDALSQPRVLVYRDYHCRNLLLRPGGGLGLIDFQDAVVGPLCYDLASLLKDCYLRWPASEVRRWALAFRAALLDQGRPAGAGDKQFLQWFDWIGLHRHVKVLGNFTRLALRDGKPRYLADVPLVLHYVREVLPAYREFAAFADWFNREIEPRVAAIDWAGESRR